MKAFLAQGSNFLAKPPSASACHQYPATRNGGDEGDEGDEGHESHEGHEGNEAKKVGRKSLVFAGTRVKTTGGLKKQDLTMNKRGKVVSKKMHANGKKAFSHIKAWHVAVTKARQALGVNGFIAIGGKKPEGKALYAKAKAILEGK